MGIRPNIAIKKKISIVFKFEKQPPWAYNAVLYLFFIMDCNVSFLLFALYVVKNSVIFKKYYITFKSCDL